MCFECLEKKRERKECFPDPRKETQQARLLTEGGKYHSEEDNQSSTYHGLQREQRGREKRGKHIVTLIVLKPK